MARTVPGMDHRLGLEAHTSSPFCVLALAACTGAAAGLLAGAAARTRHVRRHSRIADPPLTSDQAEHYARVAVEEIARIEGWR